jgi:hypothetical protein
MINGFFYVYIYDCLCVIFKKKTLHILTTLLYTLYLFIKKKNGNWLYIYKTYVMCIGQSLVWLSIIYVLY